MNKSKSISINDQWITAANLPEFVAAWKGDPGIPDLLESWMENDAPFPAFTSGSTGKPARILLRQEYAMASAQATIQFLGLDPGANLLLSMPAEFIAGRMMIVRALVGGFNLLPIKPSSCPIIPDRQVGLAAFTPHQFQNILESATELDRIKIDHVLLGGAPVSTELIDKAGGFPGKIYETFGMTETYSHIAIRQRYPVENSFFEGVGSATFTEINEKLVIHAPHLGIPRLQTNDIVELEGANRFRWLGRADHVINSGGIKIHPESVEKKLAHLISQPFFITGQSDAQYGERVILIIEKRENGLSESHLKESMEQILDKYEKPKSIVWVDTMIYTPTGKIKRIETKTHNQIL